MIELKHLNKTFHLKSGDVEALKDVSLTVRQGEIFGVIGYSGAGKSTLVRCINLLETPDSGEIKIGDTCIISRGGKLSCQVAGDANAAGKPLTERRLSQLRHNIGMIFQHFNLLDRSTVFENIAYPLRYSKMSREEIRGRVEELLELVDLKDKRDVYPSQLSGGQKQRVAIARALANKPGILLSDEATSALDPDATEAILNLLKELNKKLGLTIVLITHEMAVIKSVCHRVAVMEDGCVVEEGSVYDIFAHPQQAITNKFVNSASPLSRVERMIAEGSPLVQVSGNARLVKLLFERDCVGDAVISSVSRQCGINLNIVLANVEILEDSPVGGMIAVISGKEENIAAAFKYFAENHITAEVLDRGTVH